LIQATNIACPNYVEIVTVPRLVRKVYLYSKPRNIAIRKRIDLTRIMKRRGEKGSEIYPRIGFEGKKREHNLMLYRVRTIN
jgi:hypothetical protein